MSRKNARLGVVRVFVMATPPLIAEISP
jgi:hypothetical protein